MGHTLSIPSLRSMVLQQQCSLCHGVHSTEPHYTSEGIKHDPHCLQRHFFFFPRCVLMHIYQTRTWVAPPQHRHRGDDPSWGRVSCFPLQGFMFSLFMFFATGSHAPCAWSHPVFSFFSCHAWILLDVVFPLSTSAPPQDTRRITPPVLRVGHTNRPRLSPFAVLQVAEG